MRLKGVAAVAITGEAYQDVRAYVLAEAFKEALTARNKVVREQEGQSNKSDFIIVAVPEGTAHEASRRIIKTLIT